MTPSEHDVLTADEHAALATASADAQGEVDLAPLFDALFPDPVDETQERAIVAAIKARHEAATLAAAAGQDSVVAVSVRRNAKGGVSVQVGGAVDGEAAPLAVFDAGDWS